MKSVIFVTTNKGKVRSMTTTLEKFDIEVVHLPLEMPEPRSDSLKEIATEKALYAFRHFNKPVIVQDAGFFIPYLGGFPRAFVNFALDTVGVGGILKLADYKERPCEFRNCLAYFDGKLKQPVTFEEVVKGKLATKPRGIRRDYYWSDLFFVFIPKNRSKTLAQMSPKEFDAWRDRINRSSYLEKFAIWFKKSH